MGKLPIKTLPVVENWDCTGCGKCCRGNVVPLDDADLQRLLKQRWHEHPDFQGIQTIKRESLFGERFRLAQRDDGTCVFLEPDGLCRIHKEFGFEQKPLICRMYPLQLVPLEKAAYLTLRRSCPTAAADQGRSMDAHRKEAASFARERPRLIESRQPPAVLRGIRRPWKDVLAAADAIQSLLTEERFPLIRRLVHGLAFCEFLSQCRIKRLDSNQLSELANVLAENMPGQVNELFRDRLPPSGPAAALFRQTVAEYLRLHPLYQVRESWRERRQLAKVAFAFARGRGGVPKLHPDFPQRTFEAIEETAFGPLDTGLLGPLNRYFEVNATSKQYLVHGRSGWSLIEKFRALALAYSAAMWMLRYFSGPEQPARETVIDIITAIDRGQGYGRLAGRQHRNRIRNLAGLGQLERIAIWYAR